MLRKYLQQDEAKKVDWGDVNWLGEITVIGGYLLMYIFIDRKGQLRFAITLITNWPSTARQPAML